MEQDLTLDINNFLVNHHQNEDEIYGRIALGGAETPRWSQTINEADFEEMTRYPIDDCEMTMYPINEGESTENMETTDDTASVHSDSTVSSHAPTIFSRVSAGTSAAHSSQPARAPAQFISFEQTMRAAELMLDHNFAQNQTSGTTSAPASSHTLWCEFRNVGDCNEIFRIDRKMEWIGHHEQHLNDQYPPKMMCWFCNDLSFKASRGSDQYSNFVERMEHIRDHIRDEYKTPAEMRPDFRMINHMRDYGLITEAKYHAAMGHNELPLGLRQPGPSRRGGSSSQQPPDQFYVAGPSSAHDLARERRQERPRGSGSGRHKTQKESKHRRDNK